MNKALKKYIEISIPLLVTVVSSLAAISSLFNLKRIENDNWNPLVAILASFCALIIGFLFYRLVFINRGPKIFTIYSHKDKEIVEQLIKSLRARRFRIAYDDEVIAVGDDIKRTISENIKNTDVILLILSASTKNDDWLKIELEEAISRNKKIFPVVLDENANMPEEIQNLKYADLSKNFQYGLRQLTISLLKIPNSNISE